MINSTPVREAPSPLLHQPDASGTDASNPAVPGEPVLRIGQIQGNILAGFSKDHQTLLFLEVQEPRHCKRWLRTIVPFIATVEEVLAFNRLWKLARRRRGDSNTFEATWLNIAISADGLTKLGQDISGFTDEGFKQGMQTRSARLGDPTDASADGNPQNWLIGGPDNEADIVLICAGDDVDDLDKMVRRLVDEIDESSSGVGLLFRQDGATLPRPLTGHEHFGFLDGVSQPGVRGRLSNNPADVLTPRQNPNNREQGKPGQDLLWPGEFVFGYKKQNPNGTTVEDPGGPIASAGPAWTQDGSFLVFRRLRQDVGGLHAFIDETAPTVGMSADLFGAKLVGRWKSGAPVLRAPTSDDIALANDDCANNNFEFQSATSPLSPPQGSLDCTESGGPFPPSPGDTTGQVCPFDAHIRKAYPRDDTSSVIAQLNERTTQTHRLLRRGIPFGVPFDAEASDDDGDRGLLFLAYQTSIETQFEFVTGAWVNNPNFKEPPTGIDPILGQAGGAPRPFQLLDLSGHVRSVTLPVDWVVPTGGGYFFAPSIDALTMLSR